MPETIGRFRIEAVLGRGGMGEVYKAFDPTLQRSVAVKTIRPDIDRPEYLERMMREAQACARLSHPNIVTIFEAGQQDGVVFIAMELLQGQNLADTLERRSLSLEQKIHILANVLEALEHAHAFDVVHRDIKPANVHVQSDGTIKLMDFGLARVMTADTITASGNVLGTPHYASPEQLKGEAVDRRTDIYSVGVMAYEMLAGRRPFEPDNSSISSVIIKVLSEAPKPMDTEVSRLLPDIEAIVSKAMAKSADARYQTAADMRRALIDFLEVSRARLSAIESAAGTTVLLPASRLSRAATMSSSGAAAAPERVPRWWWPAIGIAATIAAAVLFIGVPGTAPATQSSASPTVGTVAGAGSTETPPEVVTTPADSRVVAASPGAASPAASPPPSAAASVAATPTPAPGRDAVPAATEPVRERTAKEMFDAADAPNIAPGLRFRMMLQDGDGRAVDVDPSQDFHSGQRVKFAFEPNIDGYLYVAQQGSSGTWTMLFPHPEINGGRNEVKRHQEMIVPNDIWLMLDNNPGVEQLFVFLSRAPMSTLPGFDRPVKAYETSPPGLIATLSGGVQSRDLILAKDSGGPRSQATYVVNKGVMGNAVTAKFSITHKP